MSSGFGGAQARKQLTTMATGCLQSYPATRLINGDLTDVKLKEGEIQYKFLHAGDLPSWHALNTPKEDTANGVMAPEKKTEEDRDTNQNSAADEKRQSSVAGGGRGGGTRHGGRVRRQGRRTQRRAP